MNKFYSLLLALIFASFAANATTVYFENTSNWSTINAYAWSPNNAGWPGVKITTTPMTVPVQGSSETKTLYYYELPGAQAQIIFNNGSGQQTGDLPVKDGAVYSYATNTNNGGSLQAIGHISNGTFIPAGEIEITYSNIYIPYYQYKSSTNAYIYSWSPVIFGDWPGTAMEKVTVNNIEFWTVKINDDFMGSTLGGWKLSGGAGETSNLSSITLQPDYVYTTDATATPLADYKLPDDISDKITYNLRGTLFGTTGWVDYEMTNENGVWYYTGDAVPGDFGIAQMTNGAQSNWYSADGKNTIDGNGVYACKINGTNFANKLTGSVTFAFDPEAVTLTISGDGKVDDKPIDYTSWYLNVLGGFNSWGDNGVAFNADGTAVNPALPIGNSEFKLKIWNGQEVWLSNGSALLAGKTYSITGNSDTNMTIKAAKDGDTYNVAYDAVNQTIKVEWAGEPLKEAFVIGLPQSGVKDFVDGEKIYLGVGDPTTTSIYYTLDGSTINIPDFGEVIYEAPAAGPRKLEAAVDPTIPAGTQLFDSADPIVFHTGVDLNLKYVAYNPAMGPSNVMLFTVNGDGQTTGIDNVAVDNANAPVEYFNLQGVRVAEPTPGLYIRRQGAAVSKVIVK